MSDPLLLEAVSLRKTYPRSRLRGERDEHVAVQGISFKLPAAASLGIVGESGAGKSTVAKMLVGLEQPTGGEIRLDGRPLENNPRNPERKRRAKEIQIVFQDPFTSFDPMQQVGDAVEEILRFHFDWDRPTRRGRVDELFDAIGLSHSLRQAYPSALSGGQLQRVAIMRALAVEPRVLVLDEHVAALDVSIQAQILNLLTDLRRQTGVAFLVISHDLAVIHQSTDQVIVMRSGKVVEVGATTEVLQHPREPYTRALRQAVPRPGWRPSQASAARDVRSTP